MPIIKRRPKELLRPITFRLPESLTERLMRYADFVNVPQAEIVAEAIAYAMDSDKEFAADCTHSAIQKAPAESRKAKAGAA
jgi:predicted DNA-binding protein